MCKKSSNGKLTIIVIKFQISYCYIVRNISMFKNNHFWKYRKIEMMVFFLNSYYNNMYKMFDNRFMYCKQLKS